MAMANKEYWQKRALLLEKRVFQNGTKLSKKLEKEYLIAIKELTQALEAFYARYAKENGLTYQEAQRLLNVQEHREYSALMDSLRRQYQATGNPRLLKEMDNLTVRAQVTRLQALINELVARIGLFNHRVTEEITAYLVDTFRIGYYQSAYDIQKGLGAGVTIPALNENAVKKVLSYPWSGELFSDRLWNNKEKLISELKQALVQGIIQGKSIQKMSQQFKERLQVNRSNAERILRTESAYFLSEGSAKAYEANGVEKFEFLATLDSRTSQICRQMDGKIFPVSERAAGVNMPPLHPRCRSTIMPYFDDINPSAEQRRARDENGKGIVIQNMSYNEWYQQFVQ